MSQQITSGEKLIPVFFVDEIKVGHEFDKSDWPEHLTLFPPVESQYSPALGVAMRLFINPIEPFAARINGEGVYGTDEQIQEGNGVPVYTLERSDSLLRAHKGFINALAHLPHDPQFRRPYNPHVSKQHNGRTFEFDEEMHVEGLSVVTREPASATWKVVDKMRFKGEAAMQGLIPKIIHD